MSALQQRQRQMMAWLNDGSQDIAPYIAEQVGLSGIDRLSIYRTGWRIRLRETIDTDHPELGKYLGDELHSQMLDGYLKQYPSQLPSLRQFADQLPTFLSQAQPFCEHPQIAELARFERILLTAFDAADSKRATPEQLLSIPPEQWPELHFAFHPSVQIFSTDWNAVQIWQALKGDNAPPTPSKALQHWLVWRNHERLTEFVALSPLEEQMLRLLLKGHPLADAAEILAAELAEHEAGPFLLNTLQQWLLRGWVFALNPQTQLTAV